MAEGAAHRDNLAFVMEGVGEDVVKHEGRRADSGVSIRETECGVAVELLIVEAGEIVEGLASHFAPEGSGVGDGGPSGRVPGLSWKIAEAGHPTGFAAEQVNDLSVE
jgi:hypothetical protein